MYADLISVDYIYKWSFIDKSVDSNLINPHIRIAQTKWIQSILGKNLYEFMMQKIYDDIEFEGIYLDLQKNYVSKCLMWYTILEAMPFLNWKINNKSVATNDSQWSRASGKAELESLMQSIKNNAEHYAELCVLFLKENSNLIPEYISVPYAINPENTGYSLPIWTGF